MKRRLRNRQQHVEKELRTSFHFTTTKSTRIVQTCQPLLSTHGGRRELCFEGFVRYKVGLWKELAVSVRRTPSRTRDGRSQRRTNNRVRGAVCPRARLLYAGTGRNSAPELEVSGELHLVLPCLSKQLPVLLLLVYLLPEPGVICERDCNTRIVFKGDCCEVR